MPTVTVRDPSRQNLAAYFLRSVLARRAADPSCAGAFSALSACVAVDAGGMVVSLRPTGDGIEIGSGPDPEAKATVVGDLSTLLSLCRGGSVVEAWMRGAVRTRGNPLRLLPLLRLFREPAARN